MKKTIEEALIDAVKLVSREGGLPQYLWMSLKAFKKLGIDQGFTEEYMNNLIANLSDEADETKNP